VTEGGPIPLPPLENNLQILDNGRRYAIVNRHLGAHLEGSLAVDGVATELNLTSETFVGTPVVGSFSGVISVAADTERSISARFRLIPDVTIRDRAEIPYPNGLPVVSSIRNWNKSGSEALFIIRRNLEYILGNCTFPVSDTEVAIVTDHVALPLGWNRDN